MLQIAVVEDDVAASDTIRTYLNTILAEKQMSANIHVYDTAEQLIACRDMRQYHMALFEIELPGINGMEAAKRFREANENAVIIFVTNMAQYAIRGYEVDALDFVLKPVSYYQFSTKLARALQRVQRRKGGQIALQTAGGVQLLNTEDIYWLETRDRMLHYHTSTGVWSVRSSLQNAEKQLAPYHFARCNQCYLVNLRHVTGVQNDFVQIGQEQLEISRRQRAAFLAAVAAYVGGAM